jgi:hypothetical protein
VEAVTRDSLIEAIKQDFKYDPDTGTFIRIRSRIKKYVGQISGSLTNSGYLKFKCRGIDVMAHRGAWAVTHGYWPVEIDHINKIKTDNRLDNLQEVTSSLNSHLVGKRNNNSSGYLGVSWHKASNKWRADISRQGERTTLGYFNDPAIAYEVYLKEKLKLLDGLAYSLEV